MFPQTVANAMGPLYHSEMYLWKKLALLQSRNAIYLFIIIRFSLLYLLMTFFSHFLNPSFLLNPSSNFSLHLLWL